jgi:hypothetical protein
MERKTKIEFVVDAIATMNRPKRHVVVIKQCDYEKFEHWWNLIKSSYSKPILTLSKFGAGKITTERITACLNAMNGIEDPQKLRDTWDAIKHLELDAHQKCNSRLNAVLEEIGDLKNENNQIFNMLHKLTVFASNDFKEGYGARTPEYEKAYRDAVMYILKKGINVTSRSDHE